MSDLPIWYCSISKGHPYTAVRIAQPVYPRAEWGKGQVPNHASCSIRHATPPTYERFIIEFEDATGCRLPEKQPHLTPTPCACHGGRTTQRGLNDDE